MDKGWHSKVGKKSTAMNPVKKILQDRVNGKFNNAEEAKEWYKSAVYEDDQKIKKLDNKTDRNKDMINLYDQVRKFFITPSPIPDMDYVLTCDESDDKTDEIDTDDEKFYTRKETPRDMPDLESEDSGAQTRKQKAQGLKILTPQQMLSRLPISLAQLKAGNNSEKLKNEIR